MQKNIIISLGLIFLLSAGVNLLADLATEERFGITFPQLAPITLPTITEYKLKNGMTFLLCEEKDFPTISINVEINAGSIFDEPDKVGTAEITAVLLRSGGTKNHSATELDHLLDNMSISLSSSTRSRSASMSMSFLSEDRVLAFNILNDVLRYPVFQEDTIVRTKMRMNTSIARRNEEISDIAFREFHNIVYGKESPYAREIEYSTLLNIKQEDLIKYHKEHYIPQNIYISIVGDFQTRDMQRLINNTFGKWQTKTKPKTMPDDDKIRFEGSVNLVSLPESEQTWIVIGHRATITQRDADFFPMLILNDILGGGFTGRIYQRVRNQMGLAYAPGAYYPVYLDVPGNFYLMSQTKTDRTIAAIEALIDEVRIIQQEPVTAEELHAAKESYLNSFVFNYSSNSSILRRQLAYKRLNYPSNFMEQIRDKVYDVTIEDIHRVANLYLKPDDFVILAAGNDAEFDKPLSTLGEVNLIDITIPQPQAEERVIDQTKIDKGNALFHKVRKSFTAEIMIENISLTGISTEYRDTDSSRVRMNTYIEFPDKFRQDIDTPNGNVSMVYNKGEGIMKIPGRDIPLPAQFRDKIISQMKSNPIGLANYYYEDFEIALIDEVVLSGVQYYVLSFKDNLRNFLLFIDKVTLLPYQSVYDDFQAMKTIYVIFSDYKKINGVQYPTYVETKDESGTIMERTVYESIDFNTHLPEGTFSIE